MVKEFQFHMYKGSSKQGNLVNFLEEKKTENNKGGTTTGVSLACSFNTEQVLWPSRMSVKIGLYQWKHWYNLHYSIANSNAT